MNDFDHLDDDLPTESASRLASLLEARVDDVHPDLAQRASMAVRTGTRIRRRRRLATATAGLGGVAAVALVGTQLLPGSSAPVPSPGGYATEPSSAPSPSAPSASTPSCEDLEAMVRDDPGLDAKSCGSKTRARPQDLPVALDAPGWTCEQPADDKFTCTSGGSSILVVMRPAEVHDAYLKDPDKADPDAYVSDIHDGHFVTMSSITGAAPLAALADSLVWD